MSVSFDVTGRLLVWRGKREQGADGQAGFCRVPQGAVQVKWSVGLARRLLVFGCRTHGVGCAGRGSLPLVSVTATSR